jgi:hypothetical protein
VPFTYGTPVVTENFATPSEAAARQTDRAIGLIQYGAQQRQQAQNQIGQAAQQAIQTYGQRQQQLAAEERHNEYQQANNLQQSNLNYMNKIAEFHAERRAAGFEQPQKDAQRADAINEDIRKFDLDKTLRPAQRERLKRPLLDELYSLVPSKRVKTIQDQVNDLRLPQTPEDIANGVIRVAKLDASGRVIGEEEKIGPKRTALDRQIETNHKYVAADLQLLDKAERLGWSDRKIHEERTLLRQRMVPDSTNAAGQAPETAPSSLSDTPKPRSRQKDLIEAEVIKAAAQGASAEQQDALRQTLTGSVTRADELAQEREKYLQNGLVPYIGQDSQAAPAPMNESGSFTATIPATNSLRFRDKSPQELDKEAEALRADALRRKEPAPSKEEALRRVYKDEATRKRLDAEQNSGGAQQATPTVAPVGDSEYLKAVTQHEKFLKDPAEYTGTPDDENKQIIAAYKEQNPEKWAKQTVDAYQSKYETPRLPSTVGNMPANLIEGLKSIAHPLDAFRNTGRAITASPTRQESQEYEQARQILAGGSPARETLVAGPNQIVIPGGQLGMTDMLPPQQPVQQSVTPAGVNAPQQIQSDIAPGQPGMIQQEVGNAPVAQPPIPVKEMLSRGTVATKADVITQKLLADGDQQTAGVVQAVKMLSPKVANGTATDEERAILIEALRILDQKNIRLDAKKASKAQEKPTPWFRSPGWHK